MLVPHLNEQSTADVQSKVSRELAEELASHKLEVIVDRRGVTISIPEAGTFGIGRESLDFVADRSTHKQGRYMPGVHVPIVPPARLLEAMPDYTLLLTWNFADEILAQQAEYRRRGGKFIIPIPEVRVV